MVQVKPVVLGQFTGQDFRVVDDVVRDFSVGQHQRHRVVPWLFPVGTVHRNFGRHLQLDPLHVHLRVRNLCQDLRRLNVRNDLMRYASNDAFVLDFRNVGQQETPSPVIQKPLHLHPIFKHPKGNTVGLEVVGLASIHGDQNPRCPRRLRDQRQHQGHSKALKTLHQRKDTAQGLPHTSRNPRMANRPHHLGLRSSWNPR